jgi:hypothetical protein
LNFTANNEEAQANLAPATGDILKNMAIGGGIGAGVGSIVPIVGTAAGAAAGAGIAGIGTAINDLWRGKEGGEPAAPAPAKPKTGMPGLQDIMTKVSLPPEMHGKVLAGYQEQLEYHKVLGVPDPKDTTGKTMTTDPATVEAYTFQEALQAIPLLKQQAAQDEAARAAGQQQQSDFIRRTTALQAALQQAAPSLLTPSNFIRPGEYEQASQSLQLIPTLLAANQQADRNRSIASSLDQGDMSRMLAGLPQNQADDFAQRKLSREQEVRLQTENPELYPNAKNKADTETVDEATSAKK